MTGRLFVGLMSGTSIDAVDCALLDCTGDRVSLLATHEHAIPGDLRQRIADISHCGTAEIERMGALDRELGQLFAAAALHLLEQTGTSTARVSAIGSHGQTIRHRPASAAGDSPAFTLQIGDPNTIAEVTGITTVADFRRRDIAAGGEGAPLAPAFHAAAFAAPHNNRAIVNIGGISNATLLRGMALEQGFDTGPGNTLLDHWVRRHRGQACDLDGRWAASATVHQGLLDTLLSHTYFDLTGPRSTGKEAFNLDWLDQVLRAHPQAEPGDIQATLAQFTVESIARGIASAGIDVDQVYVCGGGAHNTDLMDRLRARLAPAKVDTTAALGMNPDWVEAAAFAWLAQRTLDGLAGNAPAVTGAAGERILGGVFAGSFSG